jgi:histone H3/H4
MPDPEIPAALLQSLLQLHADDKKTRISQSALNGLTEYVKTFVREAIYRAAEERKQVDSAAGRSGTVGSMFLEVRYRGT